VFLVPPGGPADQGQWVARRAVDEPPRPQLQHAAAQGDDDPGGVPGTGRFQFQSKSPEGRKVRAYSSAALPRLEPTATPEG
jgi:hypothetical protein